MCEILLSIKPEHIKSMFEGKKKYEFRKVRSKKKVDKIIIYATVPIKKIVGEATVIDVLEMEKAQLWSVTKKESGISKKYYDEYYDEKKIAIAYKLGEIKEYDSYIDLIDLGLKCPPQSFVYL